MTRLLDILLSGIALVLLSPLLIPVVLALRFSGEGEIFFIQKRVGLNGEMFGLYKFATMLKDSPNLSTGTVTVKDDPRILPIGKFLRKTKVNELPQLLNIVFGSMSIIGPRPQTQRCFDAFPKPSQDLILTVRPGLSGIGSIIFRGEECMMHANADPGRFYDEIIMPYKGLLEVWFVKNQSLFVYLKCIWLTVWVVLKPNSQIVWSSFRDLPVPPQELKTDLNWTE